jgi:hypothetical protein
LEIEIQEIVDSPQWIPVSFSSGKSIIFQEFEIGGLRESIFLDKRAKGKTGRQATISIEALRNIKSTEDKTTTFNQIFHISHVGSTFVANLLQDVPGALVFREPTMYREVSILADDILQGASEYTAEEYIRINKIINQLFTKTGFKNFVKQTSGNLNLPKSCEDTLENKHVLYLYTSAKHFLSHALTSRGLVSDSISGAKRRMEYINRLSTCRRLDMAHLDPLEKVALIWLAEFQKIVARTGLDIEKTSINFDKVLIEKGENGFTNDIVEVLGLHEYSEAIKNSESWSLNSKSKEKYSSRNRLEKLESNYQEHKLLVDNALTFIRKICENQINFNGLANYIE